MSPVVIPEIGYELVEIIAGEIYYKPEKLGLEIDDDELEHRYFWNWSLPDYETYPDLITPVAVRFGVIAGITLAQEGRSPEVRAVLLGDFKRYHGSQVSMRDFIGNHAPPIMFPFLRQVVADLTQWRSGGPLFLPIVDARSLILDAPFELARGTKDLIKNPEIAAMFEYTPPTAKKEQPKTPRKSAKRTSRPRK